jgi:hypothetical protein
MFHSLSFSSVFQYLPFTFWFSYTLLSTALWLFCHTAEFSLFLHIRADWGKSTGYGVRKPGFSPISLQVHLPGLRLTLGYHLSRKKIRLEMMLMTSFIPMLYGPFISQKETTGYNQLKGLTLDIKLQMDVCWHPIFLSPISSASFLIRVFHKWCIYDLWVYLLK